MSTALSSSPSTSFDMALGLLSSSILVAKVRMPILTVVSLRRLGEVVV